MCVFNCIIIIRDGANTVFQHAVLSLVDMGFFVDEDEILLQEEEQVFVEANNEKDEFPVCWYCVIGTLFISAVGSLLHFTFHWTYCNWLVGFFVAVNESVFEHLKLLISAVLLFWLFDCLLFGNVREHLIGVTSAIYSGVFFLIVVYFMWMMIIGYDKLWFDILLFVVSALVAQITGWSYALDEYRFGTCSYAVVVHLFVIVFLQIFFTDSPPKIAAVFGDPVSGFYGRPTKC